jgi:hypothetical protein
MPLTILDPADGSVQHSNTCEYSSTSDILKLAKFLESEDVEITHLSVAPDNIFVIAVFPQVGWKTRWDSLQNGAVDWESLQPPANPVARELNELHDESKDLWDITQMVMTLVNVNEKVTPQCFRGSDDKINWPSTIIWLLKFLAGEGVRIVNLALSKRHVVVVAEFEKDDWLDRYFAEVRSRWLASDEYLKELEG